MSKRVSRNKNGAAVLRVFRDKNNEIMDVLDELEEESSLHSGANRTGRRQNFRDLECHVDIYHAVGSAPTSCLVPTRDLSANGIAFLHRSYLHSGSQISITLRDRSRKAHTVSATIMRCRYVKGMIHEIGAKFSMPIDLGNFVELEPLKLVMLFDDDAAAQVANHQFMCVGAETELAESIEQLSDLLKLREFDAIVFQSDQVSEELVGTLRSDGFARPILAISPNDDTAELADRTDEVFVGPVTPEVAAEVISYIRAA